MRKVIPILAVFFGEKVFVAVVVAVVDIRTFVVAIDVGAEKVEDLVFGSIAIFSVASAVKLFCDPRNLFYFLPLLVEKCFPLALLFFMLLPLAVAVAVAVVVTVAVDDADVVVVSFAAAAVAAVGSF